MTDQLHSVQVTAERLSISAWSVFQLIREDKIRSVKIGSRRLIPESAITEFIADLGREPQ